MKLTLNTPPLGIVCFYEVCNCLALGLFFFLFKAPENVLLGNFDILKSTEVSMHQNMWITFSAVASFSHINRNAVCKGEKRKMYVISMWIPVIKRPTMLTILPRLTP